MLKNCAIIVTVLMSMATASISFTEKLFYEAEPSTYSKEFCKTITANQFHDAIKSEIKEESKKATAFKLLFDGCGHRFLEDAIIAKSLIIHMVDSGNTKYLPILLDQGVIESNVNDSNEKLSADPLKIKYKNLDLTQQFIEIFEHLYAANTAKTDFIVRKPHQALDNLLAYTKIDVKEVEKAKARLDNLKDLGSFHRFVDPVSVSYSRKIVKKYLNNPELLGNHQPQAEKIENSVNSSDNLNEDGNFSFITGSFVILAIGSIAAAVVGLLWKLKTSKYNKIHNK